MSLKKPVHPGAIIKHDCLESLHLSVTSGARVLGVTRPTLSRLINGKAGVSPEMAIRLSKAFGSTPEFWLRLQLNYDVAQAKARADTIPVERYQTSNAIHDA
jgi:addiction module HigA family antidote